MILISALCSNAYAISNQQILNRLNIHHQKIKTDMETHDTEVKSDIETHDGNMATEHTSLADDHVVLDGKLEQILEGGGGDCPDCPDAWDKLLTTDRFDLVMNGEAVRDNETCLVWEQSPDATIRLWEDAISHCHNRVVGNRKGWHLPTVEQLTSLIDTTQSNPALPSGHPFSNVQSPAWYMSATSNKSDSSIGLAVLSLDGSVSSIFTNSGNVWCVRGGQSYSGQ